MTKEKPKPEPRYVGGKLREKRVELEWPVEHDGKLYEAITVRRMTGQQVADFLDQLAQIKDEDEKARLHFPMLYHDDGAAVPQAVIEFLDDDDAGTVAEVQQDFLPRRFRGPKMSEPPPEPSEPTPQTLPTS